MMNEYIATRIDHGINDLDAVYIPKRIDRTIDDVEVAYAAATVENTYRDFADTLPDIDVAHYYRRLGRKASHDHLYRYEHERFGFIPNQRVDENEKPVSLRTLRLELDDKYGQGLWGRQKELTSFKQHTSNVEMAQKRLDDIAACKEDDGIGSRLNTANVFETIAITEPDTPLLRKELPNQILNAINSIGEFIYQSSYEKSPDFTAYGEMWRMGDEKLPDYASDIAEALTTKVYGTLSDIVITNLPIDQEWFESYFKKSSPAVDTESIKRIRLSLGVNQHKKLSASVSQVEIVLYRLRNASSGDRIVATNRKADRLDAVSLAQQLNRESAVKASIIEAANIARPLQGGLPGLGTNN